MTRKPRPSAQTGLPPSTTRPPDPGLIDLTARRRKALAADARALYAIKDRVHYSMTATRMQTVRQKIRAAWSTVKSLTEDCSSSVTGLYWRAGAPDPNGLGYNGQGYTGTLCTHGHPVDPANARPGDLAFYGDHAPWRHVAIVIGRDPAGQPIVFSHGSEAGPYLLPLRYRPDLGEIRTYPLA